MCSGQRTVTRHSYRGNPLVWLLGATLVAPVACTCKSSEGNGGAASAGLPEIQKACEHRAAWQKRIYRDCTTCLSLAAAPKCGCRADRKEYSGLCADADKARRDDKECDGVWQCSYRCKPDDCGCLAKCYEGQERCGKLAAALDTCLVKTCDAICSGKAAPAGS
jgi:hypothetical protein